MDVMMTPGVWIIKPLLSTAALKDNSYALEFGKLQERSDVLYAKLVYAYCVTIPEQM